MRPRITYRKVHIFGKTYRLYQRWHTWDREQVPIGAKLTWDSRGNPCYDRLICQHPTWNGMEDCIVKARERALKFVDYGPDAMPPDTGIPYGHETGTRAGRYVYE